MKHLVEHIYNIDYKNVVKLILRRVTNPEDMAGNLSDAARIQIEIEMDNGEVFLHHWFVKIMPQVHQNKDLLKNSFVNEIEFYKDILPDLKNFLEDIGVTDLEFDIPKLLFADMKDDAAVIILEDATELGYSQEKDKEGWKNLTVDKARLVIESIAKIQAASSVYNLHKEVKLEKKFDSLGHCRLFEQCETIDRLSCMKDRYCEVLGQAQEKDSDSLLQRFYQKFGSGSLIESVCKERYSPNNPGLVSLQHGDLHFNNLLFKQETETRTKVMIVDWQMTYMGRSTGDVSYLLLSSLSPEVRQQHGEELKEAYVDNLNFWFKEFQSFIIRREREVSPDFDLDVQFDQDHQFEHDDYDFEKSSPLSLFLSCGNVLAINEDHASSFAYNLAREAARIGII